MKALILSFTIAVSYPAFVSAESITCEQFGELAESIMKSRQTGVPLSSLMNVIKDTPETDGNEIFRNMIVMAYDEPRYSSDNMQRRAIEDYRNLWELGCYQSDYGKNQ